MAANVDQKLHVGIPEEGGLALGARLVLHFGKKREIAQPSNPAPREFVFVLIFWGFSALNVVGGLR